MVCIWSSWCHRHPIIPCFIKIQIGLTFLVPAYPGCPGKEAVKQVSCLRVAFAHACRYDTSRFWRRSSQPNQSVNMALKKLNLMPQNKTYTCKPKDYCSTTTTITATNTTTTTTTTILWPLYGITCISWCPQLRTAVFLSKVLLPACPCWRHLAHSDLEEDARVILNGSTCTISIPSAERYYNAK